MFLVQHYNGVVQENATTTTTNSVQYLKLIAINVSDEFTWRVVQTHEIPNSFHW